MTSPATFLHRRRIEFADTDAAGVAHFSRLLVMVEEAEHAFFRSLKIPILNDETAWPVVSLDINYLSKCKFGDELTIEIHPLKLGNCSFTYTFQGTCKKDGKSVDVFKGTMTKCHIDPRQGLSVTIPDAIRHSILENLGSGNCLPISGK